MSTDLKPGNVVIVGEKQYPYTFVTTDAGDPSRALITDDIVGNAKPRWVDTASLTRLPWPGDS